MTSDLTLQAMSELNGADSRSKSPSRIPKSSDGNLFCSDTTLKTSAEDEILATKKEHKSLKSWLKKAASPFQLARISTKPKQANSVDNNSLNVNVPTVTPVVALSRSNSFDSNRMERRSGVYIPSPKSDEDDYSPLVAYLVLNIDTG
jgi:hypothetical protein